MRVDKAVLNKRMQIASDNLAKHGVIGPDECLSLERTGSAQHPYNVMVEHKERHTVSSHIAQGITLQQVDSVVDSLYAVGWLMAQNAQNGGPYCRTHDMFVCGRWYAHA